jgi:hypothetical protein
MMAQSLIPKRIVQTGKVAQPLHIRGMMANMRLLNPDFEYLFYDDVSIERFVNQEFSQYRSVFDAFPLNIQRIDFFRYLVIYRLGGFYFDIDVLMNSGIIELCDYSSVFSFEGFTFSPYLRRQCRMDWEIGNFGFGATAGHPFLEAVIENCIRAQKDRVWVNQMLRGTPFLSRPQRYVLYSTGPGLVTRTFAENPMLARSVKILFPNDVLDNTSWCCFGDYGAHMMTGTWRPKKAPIYRRFVSELANFKMRRLLRRSAALGKTRSHIYTANAHVEQELTVDSGTVSSTRASWN